VTWSSPVGTGVAEPAALVANPTYSLRARLTTREGTRADGPRRRAVGRARRSGGGADRRHAPPRAARRDG
jgi:hypothetical protein